HLRRRHRKGRHGLNVYRLARPLAVDRCGGRRDDRLVPGLDPAGVGGGRSMRGKGEGAVYRVPADKKQPLKYWTGVIELPPGPNGERRRKPIRRKNKAELLTELSKMRADLEKRGDLPTTTTTVAKWFTYWL